MSLQWKIYYWCSIYCIACSVMFLITLTYLLFTSHNSLYDLLSALLVFVAIILIGYKSILSIQFVRLHTLNAMFNRQQHTFFLIGFTLNVLLLCLLSIFMYNLIDGIIARSQHSNNYSSQSLPIWQTGLNLMLACLFPTTLIQLIFDFPLVKAIRRQYNSSIDTIGQHLHP